MPDELRSLKESKFKRFARDWLPLAKPIMGEREWRSPDTMMEMAPFAAGALTGTGSLLNKLAGGGGGKYLHHGAILIKGKVPPLSVGQKVESLSKLGRRAKVMLSENPWQRVQDALSKIGTE